METVNVHVVKNTPSRLLKRIEAGEKVIIARNGTPVAKLAPIEKRGRPQPDIFKGKIVLPDSFFDPLPEEELIVWEGDCDCEFCSTPTR